MIPEAFLACAVGIAVPGGTISVHPATVQAVNRAEGGDNPLAINVNFPRGIRQPQPTKLSTVTEAAATVRRFIAEGLSVDIGYMQINSRNLPHLGYSIEDAFDPCKNVRGGAIILGEAYGATSKTAGEGEAALEAAFSIYNTGTPTYGFQNGYVSRVIGVPAIQRALPIQHRPPPAAPVIEALSPYTAPTTVYTREVLNVRIN